MPKLKDSITIESLPDVSGDKRRAARLNIFYSSDVLHNQSDEELKTELCRNVMSELGMTDKEMIDLERRQNALEPSSV